MATRQRAATPDQQTPEGADSQQWGVTVPHLGQSSGDDQFEPIEETAQDRVFAMLKDTREAQAATVKLYRVNPGTKKLGWCQDYSVEEFESGGFENIRTIWGSGAYEIRLYGQSEGGKFACLGRSPIEIIAPITPAQAPQPSSALDRFVESQQAFNERMLEALTQKPAPADPMAQMSQMLTMMTMMREAMGLTNQAPQKSSIDEIMKAVREIRAVAEEIVPPKEDASDDPMAIVGKIADLVGKAMQNPQAAAQLQQQFPTVTLPPAVSLPIASPVAQPQSSSDPAANQQNDTTANETPLSEAEQVEFLQKKFAEVLEIGAEWASLKKPSRAATACVESAADIVDELLPDDDSLDILRGESWLTMLTAVVPDAAAHGAFLAEVRASLLADAAS